MSFIIGNSQSAWSIGGGITGGYLIKIHPDFPEIEQPAFGLNVGLYKNLEGKKWWHSYYRHPQFGIETNITNPGNPSVFGNLYSISAVIRFPVGNPMKRNWVFIPSVGLSYLTKPYDIVSNTENIVLGTHVNNITRLSIERQVLSFGEQELHAGVSISHYSNGGVHPDNIGLNIPQAYIYLYPKLEKAHRAKSNDDSKNYTKNVQPGIRVAHGFQRKKVAHGPIYSVYSLSLFVSKNISILSKISTGVELIYNESTHDFILLQEIETEDEALKASRASLFAAHELMLGQLSIYTGMGYYVYHPVQKQKSVSTKFGVQFYLFDYLESRNQIMIGTFVQSYMGSADYFEIGVGYQF